MAWSLIRRFFRDQRLSEYCRDLQSIGVAARIVEPGIPEERFAKGKWPSYGGGRLLGMLRVEGADTPFIAIRVVNAGYVIWHFAEYFVPDSRLKPEHNVSLKISYKRSFPGVGPLKDLFWRGDDRSTGLLDWLNADYSRDFQNLQSGWSTPEPALEAFPEYGVWALRVAAGKSPTAPQYRAYQHIANHLREFPLP